MYRMPVFQKIMEAIARKIRQALDTDRLFGVDAVPIHSPPVLATAPESPQQSAADASASSPASSRVPPSDAPPGRADALDEPDLMPPKDKAQALADLAREHAAQCPHCAPQQNRLNLVFGEGDADAELMFIGEGPGAEEDRQGRPFVGRAGRLLDKQIVAMGLEREQVYITNIVKTRPPGNRAPTPEEADQCIPSLHRQIEIIRPTVIVALGATAAKYLLDDSRLAITRERGNWKRYHHVDLMPTFHPAYLLRQYTKENRQRVWNDLQKVMGRLGLGSDSHG